MNRDLENKRREQRVEMLVKVYQNITKVYDHDAVDVSEYTQTAIIDAQMLCSLKQEEKIKLFVQDIGKTHKIDWVKYDEIVEAVRNDLRKELNLPEIKDKVWWIRVIKANIKKD